MNILNRLIEIVERGRGPQLSTSRVTVLDLVPYFQEACPYDEIIRWIPSLSTDEIAVAERYYRANQDALDELDRRADERPLGSNPRWVEQLAESARAQRTANLERLRNAKPNGATP